MKKFQAVIALLLLSGCGTVFSGTQQTVTVNTNVPEAKVYVNGMPMCSTPCAVELNRSNTNINIILKKDGYNDTVFVLKSQWNPITIINLSFVYSWTTDFVSGGVWKYSPDAVYVEMDKKDMTKAEAEQSRKISEIRRFVLFNYSALKVGDKEHLTSLSALTGLKADRLSNLIKNASDEIDAANKVVSTAG
ncbi:MAG: PEGA domain-containing protein [Alphaproteobacteria bacterium]|nr:PEGA domain-containing protein [Alphaproteobacteria bacterium]